MLYKTSWLPQLCPSHSPLGAWLPLKIKLWRENIDNGLAWEIPLTGHSISQIHSRQISTVFAGSFMSSGSKYGKPVEFVVGGIQVPFCHDLETLLEPAEMWADFADCCAAQSYSVRQPLSALFLHDWQDLLHSSPLWSIGFGSPSWLRCGWCRLVWNSARLFPAWNTSWPYSIGIGIYLQSSSAWVYCLWETCCNIT